MTKLIFGTGSRFGYLSQSHAKYIIDYSRQSNIHSYDTGYNYGNCRSSRLLASSLKASYPDFSYVKVSTKFGTQGNLAKSSKDFSVLSFKKCLSSTLSDFSPIPIHTLYLHGPSIGDLQSESLLSYLLDQKQQGHFSRLGVNTHSLSIMNFILQQRYPIDVVMIDLNLAQLDRMPVVYEFHRRNISVVIGTTLCQGLLHFSPLELFKYNKSLFVFLRAYLKSSSRKFIKPSSRIRAYLRSCYPEHKYQIPLSLFTSMDCIESVSVGMLSPRSVFSNILAEKLILDPSVSSHIINELSSPYYQVQGL
jgi:aryl-alcohol dehydrogenase-like predicted oxidoreductase